MFDVSWGETLVLIGAGFFLVGRRDLPRASRFVGTQVGRMVGLLQGARARADRFAANNELRHLQNELRSGLRELDQVKSEMALAASSGGLVGKGLGRTTTGVNRGRIGASASASSGSMTAAPPSAVGATASAGTGSAVPSAAAPSDSVGGEEYLAAARAAAESDDPSLGGGATAATSPLELAPRSHSVAAVAEEEWEKQGIGFRSRAEKGTGVWEGAPKAPGAGGGAGMEGGASLLSDLIQQSLIHDQYDRAVREQDEEMDRRAERIREERRRRKT